MPDLPELFRVKAAREVVNAVLQGTPVQDREVDLDGRAVLLNARPLPAGSTSWSSCGSPPRSGRTSWLC